MGHRCAPSEDEVQPELIGAPIFDDAFVSNEQELRDAADYETVKILKATEEGLADEDKLECDGLKIATDLEAEGSEAEGLIVSPTDRKPTAQDYDDDDAKMATSAAASNLVTCMIGASVLSLPRMVADSGWLLGPPLLAFAGFVSYRASMLVDSAVETTAELSNGVRPRNVGEIVEFSFGTRWKSLVIRLTCLYQVAKCGVYFVVIGTNLHFWIERLTARQCTMLATSFGIWLVFIRNINVLSRWSIIGVVASGIYLFAIASSGIYAAMHQAPDMPADPSGGLWPKHVWDLPQTFAVMLYAYSPADVLPVMKNDMKFPNELPRALAWSHGMVVGIYVTLSSIAYLGWGRSVQGNVLQSMCSFPGCRGTIAESLTPGTKYWTGYLLSTAVVANLTVTVPIVLYCVFRTLETEHSKLSGNAITNCFMRLVVVLTAINIAVFVPHFIEILAVLATALLITLQVLLPSALKLSLSQHSDTKFGVRDAALFLLGVMVMIVGLRGAIRNLIVAVSQAA